MDYQLTQEIWHNINSLGALVNTDGVEEETKAVANAHIRDLLDMLKPFYTKMSAKSLGIVTT